MFSAFQPDAFQSDAFQVAGGDSGPPPTPQGPSFGSIGSVAIGLLAIGAGFVPTSVTPVDGGSMDLLVIWRRRGRR